MNDCFPMKSKIINTVKEDIYYYAIDNLNGTYKVVRRAEELYYEDKFTLPSNYINFGFNIQKTLPNGLYHEISLSRFDIRKETFKVEYTDFINNANSYIKLVEDRSFTLGLRYEFGKYITFNSLKLGLSAAVEPVYYKYQNIATGYRYFSDFLNADIRVLDLNISLNPDIYFQVTDRFSIDLKFMPSIILVSSNTSKWTGAGADLFEEIKFKNARGYLYTGASINFRFAL